MSDRCPIGPLQAHTWNYERTECIWCGPNVLAAKPGRWVKIPNGTAWSVEPTAGPGGATPVPTEPATEPKRCAGQLSPCRCELIDGHDGACQCEHTRPATPTGPNKETP